MNHQERRLGWLSCSNSNPHDGSYAETLYQKPIYESRQYENESPWGYETQSYTETANNYYQFSNPMYEPSQNELECQHEFQYQAPPFQPQNEDHDQELKIIMEEMMAMMKNQEKSLKNREQDIEELRQEVKRGEITTSR